MSFSNLRLGIDNALIVALQKTSDDCNTKACTNFQGRHIKKWKAINEWMNEWMNECNLTLWRSKESQIICKSVFYFYDEIIKVVLQEANHNSRQR